MYGNALIVSIGIKKFLIFITISQATIMLLGVVQNVVVKIILIFVLEFGLLKGREMRSIIRDGINKKY